MKKKICLAGKQKVRYQIKIQLFFQNSEEVVDDHFQEHKERGIWENPA